MPLQDHLKCSFLARHLKPCPVIVTASRPRKLYWTAPRAVLLEEENGYGSTDARTQPESTAHRPQRLQRQAATQPPRAECDHGYWGNFCLALCIPHHLRPVPAAQPAAS
ncbi:hypothetical protein K503DRAFT_446916 [Rhizopogon vinicolor AM-OR11-026]|uniref:Uncharacterized protein n=1 Tax=Rhizopogon vinicolor AM-OR11-026 TaxID=1314800 RepID=A0A1B7NHJ6_9AGAM|nr:hypothetical protein K503DRAFT_446916 [Rhizopogon vinicolor AM-OR11-026]